jgi:paraquat-inducible protein B
MSKKANPTLIGTFVVTALGLAVAGILVFSSAGLFSKNKTYVLYFDASVTGLNPGAPVKFRGVTVGAVKEVLIRLHQAPNDLHMPVLVEIDHRLLRKKTDGEVDLDNPAWLKTAVERGFRGVLESQSLLTGLLYVELRFVPQAPPAVYHQQMQVYTEIPTVQTRLEELMASLSEIDPKRIAAKVDDILGKVDEALSKIDVAAINGGVTNLLAQLNAAVASADLTNSLASIKVLLEEYAALPKEVREKLSTLSGSAEEALAEVKTTLASVQSGVGEVQALLAPGSPLRKELLASLSRFGEAAQAVADLAGFLLRNPGALISGKEKPASKK